MAAGSEASENSDVKSSADEVNSLVSANEAGLKLAELKVVDLRMELEKRDLDKTGIKSVLLERLKNALIEDGEDPDEFIFDISSEPTSAKKKKVALSDSNGTVEDTVDKNDDEKKDEINNDITLQLSIDDEEAQLNEDEPLEISKTIANEEELVSKSEDISVQENEETPLDKSEPSTPVKDAKSSSEEVKEKKVLKTPVKSESVSTVAPKVLKVIGKNEKLKNPTVLAKSLWITGLPSTTRAADLKTLFSKQGRVLSVKIVKSAKQTPPKCYGFVTMATSKDASKAIQNLHRTELNGRTISVEKTQMEPSMLLKKSESKIITVSTKRQTIKKEAVAPKTTESTKTVDAKESSKADKVTEAKSPALDSAKHKELKRESSEKAKSRERKSREIKERNDHRSFRRPVAFRPRPYSFNEKTRYGTFRRPFGRKPFIGRPSFTSSYRPRSSLLLYEKIRDERREAERRRVEEITHHKYIERKQREEAYRLEREKEKLRLEREFLERERAEILKMEREKQRMERERLEREREELRRVAEARRSSKRSFAREPEPLWEERKKPRYEGRSYESPRYEFASTSRERAFERHPEFIERDSSSRREVTIRSREDRQVYSRSSDYRDRERRSFPPRERLPSSSASRIPREDWKHDRRVHERIVTPSSSRERRIAYY